MFGNNSTNNTVNEFRDATTSDLPPITFKVGLSKGSVVVNFTGDALTWVVKAPGSSESKVTVSASTPACPKVIPLAECRAYEGGALKIKLGYENPATFEQVIRVGVDNRFNVSPADRAQPTRFFPGRNSAAFDIQVSDPNQVIEWSLNGATVKIDSSLPACAGRCVETSVASTRTELDQVAIKLSGLMQRSAAALASVKDKKGTEREKARDRVDARRAVQRSLELERAAKSLVFQIPDVLRSCVDAPVLCVVVDRGPIKEGLSGLYARFRDAITRVNARTSFRSTGTTDALRRFVREAKALEQEGNSKLSELTRFDTVCK